MAQSASGQVRACGAWLLHPTDGTARMLARAGIPRRPSATAVAGGGMPREPATVGQRRCVSSQTRSQAPGASRVERDHARESDRATPAATGRNRPESRVCRAADRSPGSEAPATGRRHSSSGPAVDPAYCRLPHLFDNQRQQHRRIVRDLDGATDEFERRREIALAPVVQLDDRVTRAHQVPRMSHHHRAHRRVHHVVHLVASGAQRHRGAAHQLRVQHGEVAARSAVTMCRVGTDGIRP